MENNTYVTKDLAEAASLIVKKQKLLRIDREGRVCWFVFEDKNVCKKLSDMFFFGDLTVNAREFNEAHSRLKNRIFSTG